MATAPSSLPQCALQTLLHSIVSQWMESHCNVLGVMCFVSTRWQRCFELLQYKELVTFFSLFLFLTLLTVYNVYIPFLSPHIRGFHGTAVISGVVWQFVYYNAHRACTVRSGKNTIVFYVPYWCVRGGSGIYV